MRVTCRPAGSISEGQTVSPHSLSARCSQGQVREKERRRWHPLLLLLLLTCTCCVPAFRLSGRSAALRPGSSFPLRNEYQHAHSSLTHGGSASLLNEQVRMDAALLSIPFFDALDLKHVKILRSFFTRRVYAPREVVLAEGLPLGQQVFHIVISGRVEMCAKDAYGKRTVLQQFGPGEWSVAARRPPPPPPPMHTCTVLVREAERRVARRAMHCQSSANLCVVGFL